MNSIEISHDVKKRTAVSGTAFPLVISFLIPAIQYGQNVDTIRQTWNVFDNFCQLKNLSTVS
jgi:hypothetical protein